MADIASRGPGGLVVYRAAVGIDAIDEYCRLLTAALRGEGRDVDYVADGWPAPTSRTPRAWVLLQYNPFAWGRWGFAPGLVRDVLRLHRDGTPLAVMVHEAWVDIDDVSTAVVGAWQRLQLRMILWAADLVLTSTEGLARELGRGARHVPVGTTIPPVAMTKADARARLGLGDGLVVTLFGRRNPARALDYAQAAVAAIAGAPGLGRVTVLNLGADAPPMLLGTEVDVRAPGQLPAAELSHHLTASDLVLLPFTDGVSTRRTTLMASLAHGLPVLGLRGHNSDSVLLDHPGALVLTGAGDRAAYARAAVALAGDPRRRQLIGDAGRRLYDEAFDWPIIARTVAAATNELAAARPASR